MKVDEFYNKIPYPILPKPVDWAKALVPHCKYQPKRILHAGCATGTQTRSLSCTFPDAEIVAVDFAESSLKLAADLKSKTGMDNVTFHKHDLTKSLSEYGQFDLVLSYGVIHHIPQADLVMQNISSVLRNEESPFFIFFYGMYGRAGIARYQSALSLWQEKAKGLSDSDVQKALWSVATANGTFSGARGLMKYLMVKMSPYWKSVWISSNADAYIHPYVKYYSIDSIFELLDRNGFVFGDFIHRKETASSGFPKDIEQVLERYNISSYEDLTREELLSVVDRLSAPKEYEFVCFRQEDSSARSGQE